MKIKNESGESVKYDVEPSDPGPDPTPQVRSAAMGGFVSSAIGAAFTGFGCLTGYGDQAFVLAGLGFLVVGLVFQGIVLDRARRFSTTSKVLRIGGSGKTLLADDEEHQHTFVEGNWVRFWSNDDPTRMLAQSTQIFKPSATVVLRRCVDPAHTALGSQVPPRDMGYHADVT